MGEGLLLLAAAAVALILVIVNLLFFLRLWGLSTQLDKIIELNAKAVDRLNVMVKLLTAQQKPQQAESPKKAEIRPGAIEEIRRENLR